MFLAPSRKTVRMPHNFSLSLSFSPPFSPLPPFFLSPPTTTFLFSPLPLNALRRRLNSSFPPPSPSSTAPSRYLRLTDFFATFFHPCVFFSPILPFPSIFFSFFFFPFFTGSMFLFLFHGRREEGDGGQARARVTSGRFIGAGEIEITRGMDI